MIIAITNSLTNRRNKVIAYWSMEYVEEIGFSTARLKPAHLINRFIAKAIDVLIFFIASSVLHIYGTIAGLLYILIADYVGNGQSLGKKIVKIRVVTQEGAYQINLTESIIRNLSCSIVLIFTQLGFIGLILFLTAGLAICAVEIYFMITDIGGIRIGDILANTMVIEHVPSEDRT